MCLHEQKLDAEGDPLDWWKSNESHYPTMAKISKVHLYAPATSTNSERLFIKIITLHRASMKPETAEMLGFFVTEFVGH